MIEKETKDLISDTNTIISQGYLALKQILEDGVRHDVDTIELECGHDGLEVFQITSGVGLNQMFSDRDLVRGIIQALIKGAGMERSSEGNIRMNLLGEERTIKTYLHDSFGEWSYRLEMKPGRGFTVLEQ